MMLCENNHYSCSVEMRVDIKANEAILSSGSVLS
jgi:hypothetical protein